MAVTIGGEEALIYQKSPQLLELEAVIIGGKFFYLFLINFRPYFELVLR